MEYTLHYDGPNAWQFRRHGEVIGHIIRAGRIYKASTPAGSFASRSSLYSAMTFLKEAWR
jgi:hypothetical protein